MNLLQHFPRIYIVNLPERADRRQEMEAELSQLGLQVDGDQIRYFPAIRPEDAGDFPSVGARGCFLSHLAIIEDAIAAGLPQVLICEDDVAFDPRLRQAPPHLLASLQHRPWDFAYLGHVAPEEELSLTPHWEYTSQPLATTHCYALQAEVLPRLRDFLRQCLNRPVGHPLGSPMHVDGAYSLFRQQNPDIHTLMALPSLAGQRSSRSDIYPNRWYDQQAWLSPLTVILRRLKTWLRRRQGRLCAPATNPAAKGELHV